MTCEPVDIGCLEPSNFAAVAKKLHSTALDVEERIYCLEQGLIAGVNRPTFIFSTTTNITGITSSTGLDLYPDTGGFRISSSLGSGSPSVTFQNSDFNYFETVLSRVPAGVWHLGCYISSEAQGTVTDNSFRAIVLDAGDAGLIVSKSTSESNTGMDNDLTASVVWALDGLTSFTFRFLHGNTGSTMQILAGATFWFTKISDLSPLRVL